MKKYYSKFIASFWVLATPTIVGAQNLFVANSSDGTISEISAGGVVSTFASGLNSPSGLAFDGAGNLFESDNGSGNIYKFTPGGAESLFASGLIGPVGLAFNGAGNLFVATQSGGTNTPGYNILQFSPSGVKNIFGSTTGGDEMAFNQSGNLYIADNNFNFVYILNSDGGRVGGYGGSGTFPNGPPLPTPYGVAIDAAGNLFVSLMGKGTIDQITPAGVQTVYASGLDNPAGITFDGAGNLYVADDVANGYITKIAPDGTQTIYATGLNGPVDIAFQGLTLPVVPEPAILGFLAIGLATLGFRRRRKPQA
jgi:sugar lactone lactonase YvrE